MRIALLLAFVALVATGCAGAVHVKPTVCAWARHACSVVETACAGSGGEAAAPASP